MLKFTCTLHYNIKVTKQNLTFLIFAICPLKLNLLLLSLKVELEFLKVISIQENGKTVC